MNETMNADISLSPNEHQKEPESIVLKVRKFKYSHFASFSLSNKETDKLRFLKSLFPR